MKKISMVCNFFIGILSLYLVYLPLSFFGSWFLIGLPSTTPINFNLSYATNAFPRGNFFVGNNLDPRFFTEAANIVETIKHIPIQWKFLSGLLGVTSLGLSIGMTILMIFLFKRYSQKQFFDTVTVRIIRRIALLFLTIQIFKIIGISFETYILTIPTKPIFSVSFGSHEIASLLVGLVVLVVSWIMYEGQKMREEQLLTV